jgi:hypothetical protein
VGGVDLGASWKTTGSAELAFTTGEAGRFVSCRPDAVAWPQRPITAAEMAAAIDTWAHGSGLRAVSIDGPQAWKDPREVHPGVGRACEYACKTPGKTGRHGVSFPRTWLKWICFSIELFHHLRALPHVVVANSVEPSTLQPLLPNGYYVLECFPTSAWRSSGLRPLPGHSKAPPPVVESHARALWEAYGLPDWRGLQHHDHLQAVVAALAGAALVGGPCVSRPSGVPARRIPGDAGSPEHWTEGFIYDVSPRP